MNKRIIRICIIAAVIIILILTGVYFYRKSNRNAVEILAAKNQLINVLIAGSNVFRDNRHRFFAILSINPDTKKMGITLLPPNLKISTDSRGKRFKRIDEIDIDNFNKIKRSINRDLKLNLLFYVELYAPDVKRIVNMIEGLDLFILDQDVKIENVKQGLNYFDGKKTIQYINKVEGNSIYKKYDRILDIIYTLYFSRDSLKRFRDIQFLSEILKKIKTNMLVQELVSMVNYTYRNSQLFSILLPGKMKEDGYYEIDDISFKIYEKEFLAPLLLKEDSESVIKVKILNGTNVPGLARKMRNILRREGLSVVEFGTSTFAHMPHTAIINRGGNTKKIGILSEIVGTEKIYNIIDSSVLYDALIVIGQDYVK